jgi:iron complex outermembrane receptor protein
MNKTPAKLILAVAAATFTCFAAAQTTGPSSQSPVASNDETSVVLDPFTVSARQVGRYSSTEATSGGRIRVSVFDAPQSISVVTRDLIEDVGALRVLDAAKYVSGITESTIPNGLDRITIRGFQTDGQTVDGFRSNAQANLDPVFVDRIEVVKGPSAILAPSGVPGGTINNVSRKPQFQNFGTVSAQVGRYDANRAELDVNRVFGTGNNYAVRVVGSGQDAEGYVGNWLRSYAIMPMFTARTATGTQFTLQVAAVDFRTQNYLGLPLDPSTSSTNRATLLSGVPRDLNTYDDDFRYEKRYEMRAFLTTALSESISLRLATRYLDNSVLFLQNLAGSGTTGGARDPATGLYTPGVVYGAAPTFTPSSAPAMPRTLTRGGQWQPTATDALDLQADIVHQFKNNWLATTTLAGFAYNHSKNSTSNYITSKTPINFDAPAPGSWTLGALSNRQISQGNSQQLYFSETAKFLDERLSINGGYSYNNYDVSVIDRLSTTDPRVIAHVDTELLSYGAVIKPLPNTALYYSYSEIATPVGAGTIAAGGTPFQLGEQNEYGVRVQLLDQRIFATLAYFDISQSNYSVPNPANLTVPPPNPLLPALISDRLAKGWEFELRANITSQLSLVGNYTKFTNRDPNDVPFRGTAEESWAMLMNYRFAKESALSRFNVSVGADYLGKRSGDGASGVTAASTSTRVIPNQATFYVPERTLVNVSVGYRASEHWQAQLNIDNALNTEYIAAAINRFTALPGTPFNARLTLKYSF